MKILERIIFSILLIISLLLIIPEAMFYSFRWIITGKEFGKPIIQLLIENYFN